MNIQSTLKTTGFISLNYPLSLKMGVQDAVSAFKAFCDIPKEEKQRFSKGVREVDFGYMSRIADGYGGDADTKEIFKFMVSEMDDYRARLAGMANRKCALTFFNKAALLLDDVAELVEPIAWEIQGRYRLPDFVRQVMSWRYNWPFRFIRYPADATTAQAHIDKGMFTLHLYENYGGVEYLDFNHEWQPWVFDSGKLIMFPSALLQHRSGGEVRALCHRVSPTQNSTGDRFALVVFLDAKYGYWFDREKPISGFHPGFNYHIHRQAFERLFQRR